MATFSCCNRKFSFFLSPHRYKSFDISRVFIRLFTPRPHHTHIHSPPLHCGHRDTLQSVTRTQRSKFKKCVASQPKKKRRRIEVLPFCLRCYMCFVLLIVIAKKAFEGCRVALALRVKGVCAKSINTEQQPTRQHTEDPRSRPTGYFLQIITSCLTLHLAHTLHRQVWF